MGTALSEYYISWNYILCGGFLCAQTLAWAISGFVRAALGGVGGCAVVEERKDRKG
jgi:hypothetical protein